MRRGGSRRERSGSWRRRGWRSLARRDGDRGGHSDRLLQWQSLAGGSQMGKSLLAEGGARPRRRAVTVVTGKSRASLQNEVACLMGEGIDRSDEGGRRLRLAVNASEFSQSGERLCNDLPITNACP